MLIKHFTLNKVGKDYVCGDIHGCFSLLEDKLDELKFGDTVSISNSVDYAREIEDGYSLEKAPYGVLKISFEGLKFAKEFIIREALKNGLGRFKKS